MKHILVSYSTLHLLKKDKVRFFYALNGRNTEGALEATHSERIGRSVLMVGEQYAPQLREFLAYWKCSWKEVGVRLG